MDIVERLREWQNDDGSIEGLMTGAADEIERLQEALLRIQNILREGAPWFPKAIMIAHEIDSALNPTVYELGNIEVDGQPTEQEEWRDFDPDC